MMMSTTNQTMSKLSEKLAETMDRFHIASRIEKGLEKRAATHCNRSSDLLPLEREYTKMKTKLGVLKSNVKEYYTLMEKSTNQRVEMAASLAELARGTPIHDSIGAEVESPASFTKESLLSVENGAATAAKEDLKSLDKVIDFISEWEAIITDKVEGDMNEVRNLHKNLNHYQNKVKKLRKREESIAEKTNPDESSTLMPITAIREGVVSPEKLQEKRSRNEEKLDGAWKKYESRATHLCDLLEEVTGHGWELLHHLTRLVMKFEASYADNMHQHLSKLPMIMDDMTEAYRMHEGDIAYERGQVPCAVDEYDSDDSTTDDESEDSGRKGVAGKMKNMMTKIAA